MTLDGEPLRPTKELKKMMVAAEQQHEERGEAEDPWTGHGHIVQIFGSPSSTQNRNLLWVQKHDSLVDLRLPINIWRSLWKIGCN
jgi:hypothetical protein